MAMRGRYKVPGRNKYIYMMDYPSDIQPFMKGKNVAIKHVSDEIKNNQVSLVALPITDSPYATAFNDRTNNPEKISKETLQSWKGQIHRMADGTPIVLGTPVDRKDISDVRDIKNVTLDIEGHNHNSITAAVVVICITSLIVASLAVVAIFRLTKKEENIHKEEWKKAEMMDSYLANVGKLDPDKPPEERDIDADGKPDIRTDYYNYGRTIDVALNETGRNYLGAPTVVVDDGLTPDEMMGMMSNIEGRSADKENNMGWVKKAAIIGGLGLAGYAGYKIISNTRDKNKD